VFTYALRILFAACVAFLSIVVPFILAVFVRNRFGLDVPRFLPLIIGLGLAYFSFFKIAGKQIRQAENAGRERDN